MKPRRAREASAQHPDATAMRHEYDMTYLAFGAGVQSTALLVCSALGLHGVPKIDLAVFADTGDEPEYVYEQLQYATEFAAEHGISVETCSAGHLSRDLKTEGRRFAAIPAWTLGADGREAPLRRQCTREYKVAPIEKLVRARLGYRPRQRIKERVRCLLGISLDEVSRIKPSRTPWVTNEWPLVDARLRRHQCVDIVVEAGLPVPSKSSCVFCPYHSDRYYKWMKEQYPRDFEAACVFDDELRNGVVARYSETVRSEIFIHRTLQPLRNVDFNRQPELFDEECEGYCGV